MGDENEEYSNQLSLRAKLNVSSIDVEARTVEMVWATPTRVMRRPFFGEPFMEELVVTPRAVNIKRLNSGAPLLDVHRSDKSAASVWGAVVPGSVRIKDNQGTATIRFDDADNDPEAEKVFRKIQNGILSGVSVGYSVQEMKRTKEEENGLPVFRVTKWEPHEVSVAPMPADIESKFRSLDMPGSKEETPKPAVKERTVVPTPAPVVVAPVVDAKAEREAGARAERTRCTEIRSSVETAGLELNISEKLIEDGVSIDEARTAIFAEMKKRTDAAAPLSNHVTMGEEIGHDAIRTGLTSYLVNRHNPKVELVEEGKRFVGLTLMEIARDVLHAQGVPTRGMSRMKVAGLAFRAGQHTTSDFPNILADVANKTLRAAYSEKAQTFEAWTRSVQASDFKNINRMQLGDAPALEKVLEGGEFKSGTISEGKETYFLATYGKIFSITRQAIINDDLDAFTRLPGLFGTRARELEGDVVYDHFLSSTLLGDGLTLFDAAHNNTGPGAVSIASVGAGRLAMREQVGLDGARINVAPMFLLHPAALETEVEQFLKINIFPVTDVTANPFKSKLIPIVEPRLDDDSTTKWYLIADPSAIDTQETATLEGENGPSFESENGFDVDGLRMRIRHDFASKVIDFRGFYRSTGV